MRQSCPTAETPLTVGFNGIQPPSALSAELQGKESNVFRCAGPRQKAQGKS